MCIQIQILAPQAVLCGPNDVLQVGQSLQQLGRHQPWRLGLRGFQKLCEARVQLLAKSARGGWQLHSGNRVYMRQGGVQLRRLGIAQTTATAELQLLQRWEFLQRGQRSQHTLRPFKKGLGRHAVVQAQQPKAWGTPKALQAMRGQAAVVAEGWN